MELTNQHLRAMMFYDYSAGLKAAECHRKLGDLLPEHQPTIKTVENWFRKFKAGATSMADEPRSGRPTVVSATDLRAAIMDDRHATCRDLALDFKVHFTTISDALRRLNLSYKFNRWVPHELSPVNKRDRVRMCTQLLKKHNSLDFFDRVITCDEKWVYYNNTGRQGEWVEAGAQPSSVARRGLTNKKVLMCVWWDCRGIIYQNYLKPGETIDSESYIQMLMQVQEELLKKRTSLVTRKGVIFHQDNARPHTSAVTKEFMAELGWELMMHPPYSPDLAPSDYYLFSHLQLFLRGGIFNSADDVISDVKLFFNSRTPEFYSKGIKKLPKRWQKVIDLNGDYYPH